MTPAALADVVTNSRAKVAAGDSDYLDVAVVALAERRDAAVALLRDVPDAIILAFDCEADDGAIAATCAWLPEKECLWHRRHALLANRPAPAKEGL